MNDHGLDDAIRALDHRILVDPLNTPERFAAMTEAQRAGGLLHGDRPICPFLRPHVIRRSAYEEIARVATAVYGALERLVEAALADDAILAELGVTADEAAMARIDPGYARACVT